MFREKDRKKYGAGTVVSLGSRHSWLIIKGVSSNSIAALNLGTLTIDRGITVLDVNWITRDDFDNLFEFNNCTISDYSFIAGAQVQCTG